MCSKRRRHFARYINTQEFTGAQRNEEDIGDETKDFTGTQITGAHVTGALNIKKKELFTGAQLLDTEDDWIVTGAPHVTGAQSFTGAQEYVHVTDAPQENITSAHTAITGAPEENIEVTGAPFMGTNWKDV